MARGWESKSVEMQIEEKRSVPTGPAPTAEEAAKQRERQLLEMSRTRLVAELEVMTSQRLRVIKRKALAHVNELLKNL